MFALVIFFIHLNSYSQNNNATKSETESWILVKLKTNTPYNYFETKYFGTASKSGSNFSGFKYSFDEYNLNISFEEELTDEYEEYYEDGVFKKNKIIKKHNVSIPIYDIISVYEYDGYLGIHTDKETISNLIIPSYEKLSKSTPSISNFVNSTFLVKFNFSQPDLAKRLQKAFLHLKKFYKKQEAKELF